MQSLVGTIPMVLDARITINNIQTQMKLRFGMTNSLNTNQKLPYIQIAKKGCIFYTIASWIYI